MNRARKTSKSLAALAVLLLAAAPAAAQRNPKDPTWWDKYTYLAKKGPLAASGTTASLAVGANVDVSNECGPQSETYVALDTGSPARLAGGSNEILSLPMRGYFSTDGGATFGPNVRVTDARSNEHDCAGVFPCAAINDGNQQGDYSELVADGGVAYPIWTDSRNNREPAAGCRGNLAMEEISAAAVP